MRWLFLRSRGRENETASTPSGPGLIIAQENLAIEYYTGENVAKSYEKAFYWAQKAALQEKVNAQNLLGLFYEEGVGTTQSYEKAFE